jgi:hypothetical protein
MLLSAFYDIGNSNFQVSSFLMFSLLISYAECFCADLKLKWRVPCGPNSVITFPSVPMLKPWYWWSYPTLPLGIAWHEKRRATIG